MISLFTFVFIALLALCFTMEFSPISSLPPFASSPGTTIPLILPIPIAIVESLLDPDLQLMNQTVTPPGTHPVLIVLNSYYDLHSLSFPMIGVDFREFAWNIPFLQLKVPAANWSYNGPFLWIPADYFSNDLAVIGAKIAEGVNVMPMELCTSNQSDFSSNWTWTVSPQSNGDCISNAFAHTNLTADSDWYPWTKWGRQAFPGIDLQLHPQISRAFDMDGMPFLCTEYSADWSTLVARSVSAEVTFYPTLKQPETWPRQSYRNPSLVEVGNSGQYGLSQINGTISTSMAVPCRLFTKSQNVWDHQDKFKGHEK